MLLNWAPLLIINMYACVYSYADIHSRAWKYEIPKYATYIELDTFWIQQLCKKAFPQIFLFD